MILLMVKSLNEFLFFCPFQLYSLAKSSEITVLNILFVTFVIVFPSDANMKAVTYNFNIFFLYITGF